jgi:hypothetical protein
MSICMAVEDRAMPNDRAIKRSRGSALVKVLATLGVLFLLMCLLFPAVRNARPAAYRNTCANQLHQIAIAIHNYVNAHHALPPLYTTDVDGKPLHSWRTLILPYLEEHKLYDSIDLTKSWDDPVNSRA